MINNLRRLFVSIFGARLWLQSLELARKRDYQLALGKLIRMENMGVAPYTEYCLLRGFIEYMLSKNESSVYYLDLAIEKIISSNKFTNMEKGYLKLYANGLLSEQSGKQYKPDYKVVELDKVPNHMKDKFPLIDHPEWKHEG